MARITKAVVTTNRVNRIASNVLTISVLIVFGRLLKLNRASQLIMNTMTIESGRNFCRIEPNPIMACRIVPI